VIDPLILVRGVHIAATVLAAGTVCFLVLVAEPAARAMSAPSQIDLEPLRRRLTQLIWTALAVAILSGVGWLALLAAEIYGAPILEVCLHGGAWQVATDTRFGQVGSARLALALLLGLLILWPATRLPPLAAAALLIALLALIGHAGATPGPAGRVHLASDMVHLLGAGAWLGGLPALALLLSQAGHCGDPAWRALATAATKRFSLLGIVCVGALLASGLINSWNLLAGPRDLVATDYGRWVALKIGLFAAMVAIAAVNRFHLTPRLAVPGAMRALQRNSLAETGLGLCVLLFVGALGTMEPTAHVHAPSTEIPPDAAFVHIHTSEAMAEVTINPGRAGRVRVSIRLSREDSSIFSAAEVMVVLTPQAQPATPSLFRAAMRQSDGTWQVDGLEIGQPGIWIVKLTVTPGTGEPFVLDAPVVIER
jgi:putative copper resistance protein D